MGRKVQKKRVQYKNILIALEDEKSSRYYIRELIKDKDIMANVVFAEHIGTDPGSVLAAIEKFKVDNPKIKFEKAWIVIDKDSFPKKIFKGTLQTARQRDICVAYSNECYELWLLLHFKNVTGIKDRVQIKKELNAEFKKHFNLEYAKSEKHVYGMIIDRQDDAIRRAKKLTKNLKKLDPHFDPYVNNPSTMMHVLISCLNNMKKCKKESYCTYNES